MIEGNTTLAVDWLQHLQPSGPWFLHASDPEKRVPFTTQRFTETQVEQMANWISTQQGLRNVYYSPNVPQLTVRKHPTKEEITHLLFLHVDLDLPKSGAYSSPTKDNFDRLLSRLDSLTFPPPLLVFSGGGYQGLWRLSSPLEAKQHAAKVEEANQQIERALLGDHCWNVNRILRLPGTVNVPDEQKRRRGREPALATVVRADWNQTWSFEQSAVPRLKTDLPPDDEPDDAEPDDPDYSIVSGKPHVVDALPPRLKRAITTGDASAYGGNRSALVYYVLCSLVRRGWTDGEMLPLVLSEEYPLSAHCLSKSNPARTAQRQVDRARESVQRDWVKTEDGKILPNHPDNIRRGLEQLGVRLSLDTFARQPYVNGIGPLRPLNEDEIRHMRVNTFPSSFQFVPGKDIWHDVVEDLAWQASYHPVCDYLADVQERWDGTPRLGTWLIDYGHVEERQVKPGMSSAEVEKVQNFNLYLRAVSRLMLVAACRRVRDPGCKFDEMCVFVNPKQGTNKSLALAALAVRREWFIDSLPLHAKDQEVIEKLGGKWIVEFAELNGLRQSEVEHLKSFLSRTTDHARMAYDRFVKHPMRQCVFFASTNEPAFLRDVEDRRFWPVHPGEFDVAALIRDRDQLWGEAAAAEATGESIRLERALWAAAADVQDEHRIGDPWVQTLDKHLRDATGKILAADAWVIMGKPDHQRNQEDNRRFGAAMRQLGWERVKARAYGRPSWCYAKGTEEERDVQLIAHPDPLDLTQVIVEPLPDQYHPGLMEQPQTDADPYEPPF